MWRTLNVVRIGRLPEGAYSTRKLATARSVVCASPAYLAARGTPALPAELARHNCLRYALVAAESEWRFQGGAASGNLITTDGTVLREAALAGLGLAVLPSFMVAHELADGRLVSVLDGVRRPEFKIHAVHADGAKLARRVRRLVDHLVRAFARRDWERYARASASRTKSRRS